MTPEAAISLLKKMSDSYAINLEITKQNAIDYAIHAIIENQKLQFMIDNGLGWEDLRDDTLWDRQ